MGPEYQTQLAPAPSDPPEIAKVVEALGQTVMFPPRIVVGGVDVGQVPQSVPLALQVNDVHVEVAPGEHDPVEHVS